MGYTAQYSGNAKPHNQAYNRDHTYQRAPCRRERGRYLERIRSRGTLKYAREDRYYLTLKVVDDRSLSEADTEKLYAPCDKSKVKDSENSDFLLNCLFYITIFHAKTLEKISKKIHTDLNVQLHCGLCRA